MKLIENLIIGAGPAGLAVAGRLAHKGIPYLIVEQQDKLGYSWRNHYDRLHLHTVKQLSALPHVPFPEASPVYVSRQEVVKYLENYARHFNIQPIYNTEISSIYRQEDHWEIQTRVGREYQAKNVIISTGVNRMPNIPSWKGEELFEGTIVHSRFYKNTAPFKGYKVLVIGMGNTGAEIALDLAETGIDTTISVRSPVSIVPREVNGRPVQLTAKKLAKIPFGIGDWLGTQIRRYIIGDLTKFGVPMSKVHPAAQLRETGKTPVVDIGTAQAIKDGKIKVIGDIEGFYHEGVILTTGEQKAFDRVVLATGYKAQLTDFIPIIAPFLDKYGLPKASIGTGPFENIFFVGYDNYKLGGILGTIQTDSKTVVEVIAANRSLVET